MVRTYFSIISFLLVISCAASALNLRNPKDIQNWDSFAIVGDAGIRNSTTEMLRKNLAANKMNQLIMPGDNLYLPTSTYALTWNIWKQEGFQFPLVAIGNHHSGYDEEVAYFQMPAEYYYKESKGALFIVLNSDNEKTAQEQIIWLDKVLTQSNYPLNFLIYHHPTITVAMHSWDEKKTFQLGMRKILKKHAAKVTSLIVGHDHVAGIYTLDGLPMVISGASWESRKVKLPVLKDKEINALGLWATVNGGFWWTRLDYNALTKEAYVHFNRFDKQQDICTFRLSPKPISKSRGCQ
jgi:hypothetical protein